MPYEHSPLQIDFTLILLSELETEALAFSTLRYLTNDHHTFQPLLEMLDSYGIKSAPINELDKADFWIGDYSFGSDILLGQYYWLLCSDYSQLILPSIVRLKWLDEMRLANSLPDFFYQIEQRCIDEYRVFPLWRKVSRFKCHSSIKGNQANALGLMNLAEVWLDKR